jgi:hypothetical protein
MATGMKVSDFMIQLQNKLIEDRKVTESTANQYIQTLYSLNGKKPFNNLAFLKKFEEVQGRIDSYAPSTQLNQYMVLTSALSLFADKPTYKSAYNHWKDKMMESKKEKANTNPHEKSDTQEENWLTWDEVSKKKLGLKEEISMFISSKNITSGQYDKLLQYVVLSLYTDIAPRRNQDYLDMYVIKKLSKDTDNTKNYYDLTTHKFYFNKYKTAKTYGQQMVEVPTELQTALAAYLKHHPLARNKQKEFKLLVKQDGSNLNSVNAITRILNRIFGKNVGSSMLRHIFITSKYGNTIKDMEDTAAEMGHDTTTQREYAKF